MGKDTAPRRPKQVITPKKIALCRLKVARIVVWLVRRGRLAPKNGKNLQMPVENWAKVGTRLIPKEIGAVGEKSNCYYHYRGA